MKCPACKRDIGYHAPEPDGKGKLVPPIRLCPNTGELVKLSEETVR